MRRNLVVAVVIFLLALLASSVAWAGGSHHGHPGHGFSHHGNFHHGNFHHGHRHTRANVDIVIGAPLFPYYRPRYYAPPYYVYAYPPVVAYSSPPVYIQRGDEGNQEGNQIQPAPAFWYFCSEPRGYYPYVSQCPKGWQQVPAQPPANP
jgi:hypothetical protein